MAQLLATVLFLRWRSDFFYIFYSHLCNFCNNFYIFFACLCIFVIKLYILCHLIAVCQYFCATSNSSSVKQGRVSHSWPFEGSISHHRNSSEARSWPGDSVSHYSKQFPPPLCSRLLCLWLCLFAWWFSAECAPYLWTCVCVCCCVQRLSSLTGIRKTEV